MINGDQVRKEGQDVFHSLVYKLTRKLGEGSMMPPNADILVTMKMFEEPNESSESYNTPSFCAEHTSDDPLAKSLYELMPFGLRQAVSTMTLGEKAWIWVHSDAAYGDTGLRYGDHPSDVILPGTNLLYEIRLVWWRPKHLSVIWEETDKKNDSLQSTAITTIEKTLTEMNEPYGLCKVRQAYRRLQHMLSQLRSVRIDSKHKPEQEAERNRVMYNIIKRSANYAIMLGRYGHALFHLKHLLEVNPDDASGHCLLAQAYFSMGRSTNAFYSIRNAHFIDPLNKQYTAVQKEIQQYISLVDDVDADDFVEEEEYEKYAEMLKRRLEIKRKFVLKSVSVKLLVLLESGTKKITVKGGFPAEILDQAHDWLKEKHSETLEVTRTEKTVEIKPILRPNSDESQQET
ncbi:hypothetical protein BIW11_00332 [Tropilaelaps mercedesae]|uniref:peptidylprolyl isomerase n=1 Tax=Tropilaelaps mercedesae TaxID=418985 RepID=A0A1V9XXW1_9ACAR|nr:hypothetical protein BIW11_00332 [Tropilaelaps mercedesae]